MCSRSRLLQSRFVAQLAVLRFRASPGRRRQSTRFQSPTPTPTPPPLLFAATTFLLMMAVYKTATILFNKMHFSIFCAPMSFFDSTPSGRILNRMWTFADSKRQGFLDFEEFISAMQEGWRSLKIP